MARTPKSKPGRKPRATPLSPEEFGRDLVANPDKYRKLWDVAARKEHPKMTELQHRNSWDQRANQFGLPDSEELDAERARKQRIARMKLR